MADGRNVTAVVLAAGDGKRLLSETPKVLHRAAGRPLLAHVLVALAPLQPERCIVVTSPRRAEIEAAIAAEDCGIEVTYVVQDPPMGTADAARAGLDGAGGPEGTVLVTSGDSPLVRSETFQALLDRHQSTAAVATIVTAHALAGSDAGRIVRTASGEIDRIVEEADATEEERAINEINAGIYAFEAGALRSALSRVDSRNAQAEYYLTDVIAILRQEKVRVESLTMDREEVLGVNSRAQLAEVTRVLYRRTCERWMAEGASIVDPQTTYIDVSAEPGPDALVHPATMIEGASRIGAGAEIGPSARIIDSMVAGGAVVSFSVVSDSSIGPGATVGPYAVVRGCSIGENASVGPFASLRPGTTLERGARVGSFVETKQTVIGEDSKANHLSYLGDTEIGRRVNVGAGTITCNWDGRAKHKTVIDDDAYIGSDTMLVAPVHVGRRAATGAGSVVKGDVPDDALAVGVPARVIPNKGNKMDRPRNDEPGVRPQGDERPQHEPR